MYEGGRSTERGDVDDLLDCWEEQLEWNPRLSVEGFIAKFCQTASPSLVAAFRGRASRLEAINRQLGELGADDTGVGADTDENFPAIRGDAGTLAPGAEPISGYVLIDRLGKGGFGEVWKASSPGGFSVALKFVQADGRAGQVELRALETIKNVRHPHLLSIFGAWRLSDWVVIASELADGTLFDRFRVCVSAGQPGIPFQELLEAFSEAAKGIDFLNKPKSACGHGIQHRDIKPQNLLVSGGSVKVGDFGLARSVRQSVTGHTGSLTLAFAAPEFLEGKTSDRSDQYSLAMTWCYLRTGRLPFEGTDAQIIAAQLQRQPDLSMLPSSERSAVARALAKLPRQRWESCRDFVEALSTRATAPTTIQPSLFQQPLVRWVSVAGILVIIGIVLPQILPKMERDSAVSVLNEPAVAEIAAQPVVTAPAVDPEGDSATSRKIRTGNQNPSGEATGLVSHWVIDPSHPGVLFDAVNGLHGQIHGHPGQIAGPGGNALELDGRRDFVAMPLTTFPDCCTIATWVRPQESRAALVVFATKPPDVFGDNGFPNGIALFLNSNSSSRPNRKIHLQIHGATISTNGPAFEFGEWTHLVVSIDKPSQRVGLFVNGQPQSSVTIRRAPGPSSKADTVDVGYPLIVVPEIASQKHFQSDWRIAAFNDPKSAWFPFMGAIGDVRLYDCILGSDEVAALANQPQDE